MTDGWTDRQMDESGFLGRCPTDVENPITTSHPFEVTNNGVD